MAYKITKDKFIKLVKTEGKKRYHDKHPFNSLLYSGKLTEHQLHGWIINWFYYQKNISRRDASIISNCPVSDVRRLWMNRIINGNESSEVKSIEDIKKTLSPLLIPPTKEEDTDFYMDYGSDTSYHTMTGKGECAA